jgi:hypothetical protein
MSFSNREMMKMEVNKCVDEEDEEGEPFAQVQRNERYVYHYLAIPEHSCSRVIVCLWNSLTPGPLHVCSGLPVIYVPLAKHVFNDWHKPPVPLELPSTTLIQKGNYVKEVIRRTQGSLFQLHSNVVLVRPRVLKMDVVIEVGVICKGFLPIGEGAIPQVIEGVETCVSQVWVELRGKNQLKKCRPLISGCAFSPQPASLLSLEKNSFFYYGTVGGFLTYNDNIYGVTCGHCLTDENRVMYNNGTKVHQPSSFTSFLYDLHVLECHDDFESWEDIQGKKEALRYGLNVIKDSLHINNKLQVDDNDAFRHLEDRCEIVGEIEAGLFGCPLGSSTWTDYGLIKLGPDVDVQPNLTVLGGYVSSPPLHLLLDENEINSATSCDSDFQHPMRVYGQGATSRRVSAGFLEPIEGESFVRDITIDSKGSSTNVFHCFLSHSISPFNKGDSGTWFWTCNWKSKEESNEEDNKKIIGMGFAIATFQDKEMTCILSMKEVLLHSSAALQNKN